MRVVRRSVLGSLLLTGSLCLTHSNAQDPASTTIRVGECGVYTQGAASLVLCLQSYKTMEPGQYKLEGTLFNNGSVPACNVRIKPLGSGIQTFWPDWASNSQYDVYFNQGQVTGVGIVGVLQPNTPLPSVQVTAFSACALAGSGLAHPEGLPPSSVHVAPDNTVAIPKADTPTHTDVSDKDQEEQRAAGGGLFFHSKASPELPSATTDKAPLVTDPSTPATTLPALTPKANATTPIAATANATTIGQPPSSITDGPIVNVTTTTPVTTVTTPTVTTITTPNVTATTSPVTATPPVATTPNVTVAPAPTAAPHSAVVSGSGNGSLKEGECDSYTKAGVRLLLCVTKVITQPTLVQVFGVLYNPSDKVAACGVKLSPVNSTGTGAVKDFWPDWAPKAQYEVYYNPHQLTQVGVTAVPNADGSLPSVAVTQFNSCSKDGQVDPNAPVSVSRMLMSEAHIPESLVPHHASSPVARHLAQLAAQDAHFFEGLEGDKRRHPDAAAAATPNTPNANANAQPSATTTPTPPAPPTATNNTSITITPGPPTTTNSTTNSTTTTTPNPSVQSDSNSSVSSVGGSVHGGECKVFSDGASGHMTLCVDKGVLNLSDRVQITNANLSNSGTVPLCNVTIKVSGLGEHVHAVWPEWAQSNTWAVFFNNNQTINIGVAEEIRASEPMTSVSVSLLSFTDCAKLGGQVAVDAQGAITHAGAVSTKDFSKASSSLFANKQDAAAAAPPAPPASAAAAAAPAAPSVPEPTAPVATTPAPATAPVANANATTGPPPPPAAVGPDGKVLPAPIAEDVPVMNPDYQYCTAFKGAEATSEVTICLKNAKAWNDRKKGRIVQTNLVMINTGSAGVCNVTVEIDNLENEIGDHFPQLIDDNGFDTFPTFQAHQAPGRITNFGASIPRNKGTPKFQVRPTFVACPEPDPSLIKRKFKCSESNKGAGATIKICVYSDLKEWTDVNTTARTVAVEGFLSNTGDKPLCNITLNIQDFDKAKQFWGDWMPTFPYKLMPGTTLKYGANIPFEEGWPRVSLKKYSVCPEEPAAPADAAPAADAAAAAAPAAPATPPVAAAPAPAPAQRLRVPNKL